MERLVRGLGQEFLPHPHSLLILALLLCSAQEHRSSGARQEVQHLTVEQHIIEWQTYVLSDVAAVRSIFVDCLVQGYTGAARSGPHSEYERPTRSPTQCR